MATHTNDTLTGTVELDGEVFVDCRFEGAKLVYAGGTPPIFNRCVFDESTFEVRDHARNTIAFLRAMAPESTQLSPIVWGLIPELKR